jgi:hypothetical protein
MHTVDLYRWRLTDHWSGRTSITPHRMKAEDALAVDPAAKRIEGTLERRLVPDGPHEFEHTNLPVGR